MSLALLLEDLDGLVKQPLRVAVPRAPGHAAGALEQVGAQKWLLRELERLCVEVHRLGGGCERCGPVTRADEKSACPSAKLAGVGIVGSCLEGLQQMRGEHLDDLTLLAAPALFDEGRRREVLGLALASGQGVVG